MENELATTEQAPANEAWQPPSLHAVAITATEMAEANVEIRAYVFRKLAGLKVEREEVGSAGEIADQNGWKTDTFTNVEKRLMRQISYYEKLVLALDSGYTLVPNMPCDQFAIRVSRSRPRVGVKHEQSSYSHPSPWLKKEKEEILPAGEGHYESPNQLVTNTQAEEKLEGNKTMYHTTTKPVGFDMIEFPFAAAAPVVMTATQAAMALKLFDRIGIVSYDADPIILGQIVCRQSRRERVTSFLIAWHLDFRAL